MTNEHSSPISSASPGEARVVYLVRGAEDVVDRDDIDLPAVIRKLWLKRWWLVASTLLAAMLSVAYAMLATPVYRAEVVLLPREGGGIAFPGQLSSLAGLAGLAGLDLGSRGKQEPMGVLQSAGFVRRFIEKNQLAGILGAASPDWDGSNKEGSADPRKATEYFTRSVMTVKEEPKTGLVIVGIRWKDATQAAAWANGLAQQVNDEMRQRALVESEGAMRYLAAQLESNRNVALQQSLAKLVESEMQKVMLARGTPEFAFRVVDAAEVPRLRVWPKRTLVVIAGTILGFMMGMVIVFLTDPVRRALRSAFSPSAAAQS